MGYFTNRQKKIYTQAQNAVILSTIELRFMLPEAYIDAGGFGGA